MGRLENSTLILILAEKICKAHALLLLFFLSPKTPAPFVISSIKNAPLFVTSPLPSPPLPSPADRNPIGNAAPADPHSAVGVQISLVHDADATQPFLLTTSVPRHRRRRLRAPLRTYA